MIQFTSEDKNKMFYSFLSSLVFIAVSLPQIYNATDKLTNVDFEIADCPTSIGHLVHTLVFFLLIVAMIFIINRYFNENELLSYGQIVNYSLTSALVFYLVSNSELYALTSELFTGTISGCPNIGAILLHSIVYGLILFGIMYLPN